MKINIFWFRRDLRLKDNTALNKALSSGFPVMTVFVFDSEIIVELTPDDPRISFIYESLDSINTELKKSGSSILIRKGEPVKVWRELRESFDINEVYINKDYEAYAIQRDNSVEKTLNEKKIPLLRFKDQVIFEEEEVMKLEKRPYTIFTPYKKRWLQKYNETRSRINYHLPPGMNNFHKCSHSFPSLNELGFSKSNIKVKPYDLSAIKEYNKYRDIPSADKTSYLGPHLRFGTVSIREIAKRAEEENPVFLTELIWREFFMQIICNFPAVVTENFRSKYDNIQWRNNEKEFKKWCHGETGYPIVDAGMRQLNETGYMHNRVRMITAGFLCKHLLVDWRWGEAWFAGKLLDYELASNNGNWQWAAGTGCDAAPYFRIFNPNAQQARFDPDYSYVAKWLPDFNTHSYSPEIVEHNFARKRTLATYKAGIKLI
jgi:deoxyribodipyrimidine photo-lyase